MSARILLVEDDPGMRHVTKMLLTRSGYRVTEAETAEEGLDIIQRNLPDLLISDVQLPGISGIKTLEILRNEPKTKQLPVILLTVLGKSFEKVRGLHIGADDYITKPYDPPEFLARVNSVLRRSAAAGVVTTLLECDGLRIDTERREVTWKGKPLILRKKEYDLLALFIKNRGKLLTREHIVNALWGDEVIVGENTLNVHLKNLRDKLGPLAQRIETLINEGYRFND